LFYAISVTRVQGLRLGWSALMLAATTVVIYATNQRAAWISFAVCLGVLAIVAQRPVRRVARSLVLVGLLVFLSGMTSHLSMDRTLFSQRQQTVHERWVNNLTTFDMGLANPLFGVGYGNFKTLWPKYFHHGVYDDVVDLEDGNHNTFLGLFAEAGLAGLVPFVLVLYHMFRLGFRVYRKTKGFEHAFTLIALLAGASYMIGANFSDYRNAQFCNTTLYLLFGIVAAIEVSMTAPRGGPRYRDAARRQSAAMGPHPAMSAV